MLGVDQNKTKGNQPLMKVTNGSVGEQAQGLPETAAAFTDFIRQQARLALMQVIEREVAELCGPRYHPANEAACYRAGSVSGTVFASGRREAARRPRVRRRTPGGSEEVLLKSWQMAGDREAWEAAMCRAILGGVSLRGVTNLGDEELRGLSKTSLSRLWQKKAAALVEEVQQGSLADFDLLVLMVDAVVLCRGLVATVALGIDAQGNKRVLGFQVGSSESAEVCSDLLKRLRKRGLRVPQGRRLLAVLDGSKALEKAVCQHFPDTIIQRCLVHKERNLRGYLPKKHWKTLAALFARLRKCQGAEAAQEAVAELRDFLADKNLQARQSLDEAGAQLHALFELNVPNTLNRSLLSTNAIENVFKNLRRHIGRVCRWREDTSQADLWLASGLTLAAKGFRKISGHSELEALAEALQKNPASTEAKT
jgi:putative transposase